MSRSWGLFSSCLHFKEGFLLPQSSLNISSRFKKGESCFPRRLEFWVCLEGMLGRWECR